MNATEFFKENPEFYEINIRKYITTGVMHISYTKNGESFEKEELPTEPKTRQEMGYFEKFVLEGINGSPYC